MVLNLGNFFIEYFEIKLIKNTVEKVFLVRTLVYVVQFIFIPGSNTVIEL